MKKNLSPLQADMMETAEARTETSSPNSGSEDQLLTEMGRVDAARSAQDTANALDKTIAGDPSAVPSPVVREPDPAMVKTFQVLIGMGVSALKETRKWTDPGEEWKAQVGELCARVLDRYLPNFLQQQTEVVALAVMVGSYALENIIRESGTGNGDTGDAGKRQDHFIEPDFNKSAPAVPHIA